MKQTPPPKIRYVTTPPALITECRRLFAEISYSNTIVSMIGARALIRAFVVEEDHPHTINALQETPFCLDRYRTFMTVDKNKMPWIHINLEWWESADEHNRMFRLQLEPSKFVSNHFVRQGKKRSGELIGEAFNQDASELTSSENLFKYSGYRRSEVEIFQPREEYPDSGLHSPTAAGKRYFGLNLLEPVAVWLDSLIEVPPPEDGDGSDSNDQEDDNPNPEQKESPNGGGEVPDEKADKGDKGESKDPEQGEGNGGNTPRSSLKQEAGPGQHSDADGGYGAADQSQHHDEASEELLTEILDEASDEDVKQFLEQNPGGKQAGSEKTSLMKRYRNLKPLAKRRWETIMRNMTARSPEYRSDTTWNMQNTALAGFLNPFGGRLPANKMIEKEHYNKHHVMLFADTSGSCVSYWDRFVTAAVSLPDDKFEAELYAFDTAVHKINKNDLTLKGGGGTYFHIITDQVEKFVKAEGKYPDAVIMITDGYAEAMNIKPEFRDRWHVMLTEGGSENAFPEGCKIYQLTEFE